jgi:hypothetical protein
MRRRAWLAVCAAGAAAVGCASQGMPPGGPPDTTPPAMLRVTPESGATGASPRSVEFVFDGVVSERPRSAPSLAQLVVISPSDGPAVVDWARSRLVVRSRRGWRPNTAYTVTVLPGLADLRGNAATRPFRTVFSTGPVIPQGVIRGAAFDWMAGRPAPLARIEAMAGGDTLLRWTIAADSVGRYVLGSLPGDTFLVRAWVDQNSNGLRDPREPWDTVTVPVTDSARADFYVFPHDTIGAGLSEVTIEDSVTIRVKFDRGLHPTDPLAGARLRVLRRSDSTELAVRTAFAAAAYDSMRARLRAAREDSAARADTSEQGRRARARSDSARRTAQQDSSARAQIADVRSARDTVRREPPPVPARPVPPTEFVLAMAEPLPEDVPLRVIARDVQALAGPRRTTERPVTRRKPAPADSAAARRRPPP